MLTRYWQWTNAPSEPAATGVPFGPLRFRAWTSAEDQSAVTSLPFGPLRFRAWTSATSEIPQMGGGSGGRIFRIPLDEILARNRLLRDDELFLFVAAAFVSLN